MQRANGRLNISFYNNEIKKIYYNTPLRAFTNDDGNEDINSIALVNTSGGVVSGDKHNVKINVNNSKVMIFSQSAEKIYKSVNDIEATINNEIIVGKNSWLEWLPQETILFEKSKLIRNLKIHLSKNAESLIGEIIVLGRLAKGEYSKNIFLKDSISIYKDTKLQWLDIVLLNNELEKTKNSITRLSEANCFFTIVFSSENIEEYEKKINKYIMDNNFDLIISASIINHNLVIRALGKNPLNMRKIFSQIWIFIRADLKKLPPFLPKLWWV
ncbi:urease accessory protein UreD [Alphaproteobacteria bacterium]|nr:urease accessory protein UreD [Alphaproteobacteria bacterium]